MSQGEDLVSHGEKQMKNHYSEYNSDVYDGFKKEFRYLEKENIVHRFGIGILETLRRSYPPSTSNLPKLHFLMIPANVL